MANTPQAIKRIRQNAARSDRNDSRKSQMRTAVKKFRAGVEENADNLNELYTEAIKQIDKAAGKGLIHKNKAARDKSHLTLLLNSHN